MSGPPEGRRGEERETGKRDTAEETRNEKRTREDKEEERKEHRKRVIAARQEEGACAAISW